MGEGLRHHSRQLLRAMATIRLLSWLPAVYTPNQFERDRWIIKQAARVPSGSAVLDAGAGGAPYRQAFHHCGYTTQDARAADARELREGSYAQIDIVCDITSIPVPDASFDVVTCTEVIEHVYSPHDAVHELARVLRPGGTLFLTAPLGSGLHQSPHYFGGFTPEWYQRTFAAAGLEIVELRSAGGFFRHFAQEAMRFPVLLMRTQGSARDRIALCLLAAVLSPLFLVLTPLICAALDRLISTADSDAFTTGFFVVGRKST